MNSKAIFGLLVTVALLVWGIVLGGPFSSFLDVGSGVIVGGVTAGLLVATTATKCKSPRGFCPTLVCPPPSVVDISREL